MATVEWDDGRATVTGLTIGADDDRIARLIDGADKTGIDAPFGWPSDFVEFVTRHRHGEPHPYRLDTVDRRRPLLLRNTDRHVKAGTGINPLSVAAEKIAIVAMPCAGLMQLLQQNDPVAGPVIEVYPAAALACWVTAVQRL